MKVICNKAKTRQICNTCWHNKPHDVITICRHHCTEWAPCWDDETEIKTRCVKRKEEQNGA